MTEPLFQRLHDALQPHYSVQKVLGEGGMAIVYQGYDLSLQRDVAIKVLRPELATARAAERFRREARLIAQIAHPSVIPIHEVGEADGLSYYVMDLVPGDTLAERLRGGPLAPQEAIRVASQVLEALEVAHANGVIHRDIKPGNVFLVRGRVVIGDFGIAKRILHPDSSLTAEGETPGTPAYMAPEQFDGDVHPAIDVYAVGMLLYEALTGQRWQAGADPAGAVIEGVPRRLNLVVRKALAPVAHDRWQSAAAFREALTARGPARALTISAFLIAALALLAWILIRGPDLPPAPDPDDLALLPCESNIPGAAADTLAETVGHLAGRILRDLPRPSLVDPKRSAAWWRNRAPEARTLTAAARILRANVVAECTVTPFGDSVSIVVRLFDRGGVQQPSPPQIRGAAVSPPTDLARQLALGILQKIEPGMVLSGRTGWAALADHDEEAVRAFLIGEMAFNRDEWDNAALHFSNAIEHDSSLTLARWRLAEAERWTPNMAISVDLTRLYRDHATDLGAVDRRLLEAAIEARGHAQLAKYQELIAEDPNDAYPVLLFADELFHRGPLFGIGLDSARSALTRAAALDSSLAPTYDHLAWLLIRLGDEEEAHATLAQLMQIAADTLPPALPALLKVAYLQRFEPGAAESIRDVEFEPVLENLPVLRYARFGLAFGVPEAERDLGSRLASIPGAPREARVSGYLAQGVALFSMGRPDEAVTYFDSAASAGGGLELTLQAAQWRLLPGALGYEGLSEGSVAAGRETLAQLEVDEAADPSIRARAAWTLCLVASHDGDIGEATRRLESLSTQAARSGDSTLRILAEAAVAAGSEGVARALEISAPLSAYDSAAIERRPFERAAYHLLRGEWLARAGQAREADAEWLWYENLDVESIPFLRLQAADVDWALGTYGRLRRADLADRTGDDADRACALATDALRYLSNPEAGSSRLADRARAIRQASCPGP